MTYFDEAKLAGVTGGRMDSLEDSVPLGRDGLDGPLGQYTDGALVGASRIAKGSGALS